MAFSTSLWVWTPLVRAKSAIDFSVQDRDPAQGETQLGRGAQVQAVDDFEFVEIEIRLVEAVEQHQPISAGLDKPLRKIRQWR